MASTWGAAMSVLAEILQTAVDLSEDRAEAHATGCAGLTWVRDPSASMMSADRCLHLDRAACNCWIHDASVLLRSGAEET